MNIRNIKTISVILCIFITYIEANFISSNMTNTPRIVGGNIAKAGQFPYMALIRLNNKQRCGGAIISAQYILTAAHCVYHKNGSLILPRHLSVAVGINNQRDSSIKMIGVQKVKVHKRYSFPSFDFALLLLAKRLQFNARVSAIPLATNHVSAGKKVTVCGWGATKTGSPGSKMLRYNSLVAKSASECFPPPHKNIPSVFCCGSPKSQGVCNGDSGSAAVFNGELVGIVSFVRGGCGTKKLDGFAKVVHARKWIKQSAV